MSACFWCPWYVRTLLHPASETAGSLSKHKLQANRRLLQDRLIISTAIPQITNEFNSAGDIGWYGTAYLLTSCAFQLVFGKLYTVFSVKATFLTAILIFEAGSALCGAAPNSVAFILGRALAGLGTGGVMSGVVSLIFTSPILPYPKIFLINRVCFRHAFTYMILCRSLLLPILSRCTNGPNTKVSLVLCLESLQCVVH